MIINKDRVIRELELKPFGQKGWMSSRKIKCPMCGRNDKLGIRFLDNGGIVHCFYEFGEGMSIFKFLKLIDRKDLIEGQESVKSLDVKIGDLIDDKDDIDLEIPEMKPPLGYKRIYFDDYLDDRGFEPIQYNLFNVGKSNDILLRGYIVFLIKQKGKVVAWLARSKKDKKWHDDNLKAYKRGEAKLMLRYRNSSKTDFDKILGGYDEITENTEEVWLVEGIMDKANIDRLYGLYNQEVKKCCFTFGNRVTDYHIELLSDTNVKRIVMLYDYGTIVQVKKYSFKLARKFDVRIGEFKQEDVDAGDADYNYMEEIFSNLKDYFYFYKSRL